MLRARHTFDVRTRVIVGMESVRRHSTHLRPLHVQVNNSTILRRPSRAERCSGVQWSCFRVLAFTSASWACLQAPRETSKCPYRDACDLCRSGGPAQTHHVNPLLRPVVRRAGERRRGCPWPLLSVVESGVMQRVFLALIFAPCLNKESLHHVNFSLFRGSMQRGLCLVQLIFIGTILSRVQSTRVCPVLG